MVTVSLSFPSVVKLGRVGKYVVEVQTPIGLRSLFEAPEMMTGLFSKTSMTKMASSCWHFWRWSACHLHRWCTSGTEERLGGVAPTGSQLVIGARDSSGNAFNDPDIGYHSNVLMDDIRFYRSLSAEDVTTFLTKETEMENLIPKIGTWKITYTATDSAGHKITTNRIIEVDPLAPIITLSGG